MARNVPSRFVGHVAAVIADHSASTKSDKPPQDGKLPGTKSQPRRRTAPAAVVLVLAGAMKLPLDSRRKSMQRRCGLSTVQRRHRLYLRVLIPLFPSGSAGRKLLLKCLGSFFEFLRTHIFDMGGDSPIITKSISHASGAVTIEHVLRLSV